MNSQDADRSLQEALQRLPRTALPERDLWPGIELAINEPVQRQWPRYGALAASVVVVICASLLFGRIQPQTAPGKLDPATIAMLQSEHSQNVQTMMVGYQGQQPAYQDWETQMQQLQQAEQTIYNALREDPNNLELLKILRGVQQKQLNLIDTVFSPGVNAL